MDSSTRLGFIGLGNMGVALIKSIINKELVSKNNIIGFDVIEKRARFVQNDTGIAIKDSVEYLCKEANVLIIAVKPNDMSSLLTSIKSYVSDKLLISICAGIKIQAIEALVGKDKKIVRVMPNTPFLVSAGACGLSINDNVGNKEKDFIKSMLECSGIVFEVGEHLIDPITALSASSPAFVFLFIEALADGGVRAGLPRDMAMKLAGQSVFGAAKLYLETNTHPAVLKDMVSSPAGTTIEGIATLEKGGFRGLVMESVFTAYKKACQM